MSDTIIASLIGLAASIGSFILGKYAEKQHQTMFIRANMLKPIEEWLHDAEKMTGILGDTLSSVLEDSSQPLIYSLEERMKIGKSMSERNNLVMGILLSKRLQTGQTKKLSFLLSGTILFIDDLLRTKLLPMDNELLERSQANMLSQDCKIQVIDIKRQLDSSLQAAYSLIAQMKTKLV